MSLDVICKNVEISSLQLGERVVCFYPEDDFPHVGVLSHLPFEMPDGMKYFAIDDDLSGSTMFPVLGGRCYHAPSIVSDCVKQPFTMGMCVCINKEKWGFLSRISMYESSSSDGTILHLDGVHLFRGWFNGSLELNWTCLGNEDVKGSTEFVPIEEIKSIQIIERLYCNKNKCLITPQSYISINKGDYFGRLDAVIFPDSPLADVLEINAPFLLVVTLEFGKAEIVSSDICKTINRRFFGQYYDTCETIKCKDRVSVCYLNETYTETKVTGVVEKIVFPRTSEAQFYNVYFSGGILLRDDECKMLFIQWNDYLKIVQHEE